MKKVKLLIAVLISAFIVLVPTMSLKAAEDLNIGGAACGGANLTNVGTAGDCKTEDGGTTLPTIMKDVINIISWIVGIVSVIMIIYGGFKYITSSGNDANVTSAKNTILYAIIGLVIVALAQIIVRFVLGAFQTYSA
jgi:hypothetical protein